MSSAVSTLAPSGSSSSSIATGTATTTGTSSFVSPPASTPPPDPTQPIGPPPNNNPTSGIATSASLYLYTFLGESQRRPVSRRARSMSVDLHSYPCPAPRRVFGHRRTIAHPPQAASPNDRGGHTQRYMGSPCSIVLSSCGLVKKAQDVRSVDLAWGRPRRPATRAHRLGGHHGE